MYIGSLQKGGAERVMCNLADYFYEQEYKVTLVTTYLAPVEYEVKHAAWKRVPAGAEGAELVADPDENPAWVDPKGGDPDGIQRVFSALLKNEQRGRAENIKLRYRKLRDIWKSLNPDFILSFIGKNNIMALSTATKDGYKVVVSVRADPDMEYNTFALKSSMLATFGKAAGVIVQSNGAKDKFPGYIRKKCTILPNSVDPSFIRKRGIGGTREKKIVMVARLHENKNQALVMEAFKDATKDRFQDYRLVFYGDGPDRIKLQHHAITLGIADRVEFMGNVQHVAEHIEKARIFVLASDHEGMPNSLIEAMCLGIACISTDCPCGGPRDLIVDGVNGLLVPVQDKKALTQAMVKLLENDVLANNLGEAATKLQRRFAPDVSNAMWRDYFERIMRS